MWNYSVVKRIGTSIFPSTPKVRNKTPHTYFYLGLDTGTYLLLQCFICFPLSSIPIVTRKIVSGYENVHLKTFLEC